MNLLLFVERHVMSLIHENQFEKGLQLNIFNIIHVQFILYSFV